MEAGGALPAGSSRSMRLDPFGLPVHFAASDARADGRVRLVELHRERVTLRRSVQGVRMAVGVPVTDFRGIALRLIPPQGEVAAQVEVVLAHRDRGLDVPLLLAFDDDDVLALWKAWGRVLGLPLLVVEPDGALREIVPRLGAVQIAKPKLRRRRRFSIRRRRPSILMRRKPGRRGDVLAVHRGEREIIARN